MFIWNQSINDTEEDFVGTNERLITKLSNYTMVN